MSVISFAQAKEDRIPHWSGECKCAGCGHEWIGVGPMGTVDRLQCPSCELPRGLIKNNFGAPEGALGFACNCGCEYLIAYIWKGKKLIRCVGCGEDQTNAVWS